MKRGGVNRTQTLVLGFFGFAWLALLVILGVAPEIYAQALDLPLGSRSVAAIAFVLVVTVFIAVLASGVVQRWRWTFWLILVAFLAGALRVPASILEILDVIPSADPVWYVVLQAVFGVVQFAIGLTMLRGYRRAGVWGW